MLNKYKILTITHRQINLKEIGQFVVQANEEQQLKEKLTGLKSQFELEELFYVATCNRVMYFFTSDLPLDEEMAARFLLAANPGLSAELLDRIADYALLLEGMDALKHLYEVAASIDSLVVGEHQILGQIREAYNRCLEWGLTGDRIRLAVQNAILAGKNVYSNTNIGDKPVSIVSLAIQQMLQSRLTNDARILLVGAGQTNQLVGKFLIKNKFTNVRVFNRTVQKAEQLAETIGGNSSAHRLSELSHYREGFDCLIVCTGATEPVISSTLYEQLLNGEKDRKVVIDLSIPHNVAADVPQQFNLQYIEIEGLRILAKENLAFREQEVRQADRLLNNALAEFPNLYKQRQLELAMRGVPAEIKAVKSRVLDKVFRKEVETLDDHTRELVDRMLSYMEKKCIGIPMKVAREVLIDERTAG